jgi:multidrug efflux pump subunit AcrB
VRVEIAPGSGDLAKDVGKLQVRNARGQMIPLGAFVRVREVEAPEALDFLDGRPMVEVTANPAAGVAPARARTQCETLAEEVRKELRLSAAYRLRWLR